MRKVILDCDPGHDDAVALMMLGSAKNLKLIAVTVENGNQTLAKTGRNAMNLCCYLNLDVPVSLGASEPLIREPQTCGEIHGETGLDGFEFPKYDKEFDPRKGAQLIVDKCLENDKVTIITTGPTTNVALALKLNPSIKDHIEEIVMMGGSTENGNVTPAAEFNILCDPEAAYIIFNSGLNIKMIGLNVTRKVLVLPAVVKRMSKIKNHVSELFVDLMTFFNKTQKEVFGYEGGPLHDPVTVVSLLDKKVVKFQKMNVTIDISHGPSYGRTNCDAFDYLKLPHNCEVAMDINVDRYWDVIEQGIKNYTK